MPYRLYGTLYPTPSPFAEVERVSRGTDGMSRGAAAHGLCQQRNAGPTTMSGTMMDLAQTPRRTAPCPSPMNARKL